MYFTTMTSPFCELTLIANDIGLSAIHLNTEKKNLKSTVLTSLSRNDDFFKDYCKQLNEYFEGNRKQFNLSLDIQGTDFQKRVWKALMAIPFGELRSYKQIAAAVGNSNASRAVGMANNKNPLPIVIPCHRVIGSNGSLTGFASGIELKQKLIQFESKSK